MTTLALVIMSSVLTVAPAHAATAAVTITPSTATAQSNVPVTFTLSITCNGPGSCENTQVSFPTQAVTGNGALTDLSTWIGNSSCGSVTKTVSPGLVTFNYGTVLPGTSSCTFPVRAPDYTTLNGAQATLTPTISGSTFPSSTAASAVLTLTAGHNISMGASATARVLPDSQTNFVIAFNCGAGGGYTGNIGLSAVRIEIPLPSTVVYTGFTPRNALPGTFTAPPVGSMGGTIVYDDPTGASCGNPPLTISNSIVITVTGTVTGAVGTQACINASSTYTYIDRSVAESSSTPTACTLIVDLQTQVTKSVTTRSLGNAGQYRFAGSTYPYTFPGDWDQSAASAFYEIRVSTVPTSISSGLSYLIRDPLPCIDNLVSNVYLSNAAGVPCANPAFIPRRVTATGFAPTAANEIVVHHADGSTTNVAFASGGWTIPTGGSPVSEIEIPAFENQGTNSAGAITFRVTGYAAPTVEPGRLMRNTATSQPYLSGTTSTLGNLQTSTTNVLIADLGTGDIGRTIFQPALVSTMTGTCTAVVGLRNNTGRNTLLEITAVPSAAMYLDYLAPVGATVTGTTISPQLAGLTNGRTYNVGALTPTVVTDYDGTGRTLYRWTIPAGVVAVPGVYVVAGVNVTLNLGPGCAGTYQNDMTLGYGEPLESCISTSSGAQSAPLNPAQNADLRTNGSPLIGNYCGASAPLSVAAINPGFTVSMTVQGSLDAAPAAAGVNGKVGASGGEATYSLSVVNSGESNLEDPVVYNLLPRVGDTEASTMTGRDSQFAVTLLTLGPLPSGVTVQYSTANNPCRPEVLPSNAGCVDDWSSAPPAALSSTTALRFAYSGTLVVNGAPGTSGFTVTYEVETPAIASGWVAWNSVGVNALSGGSLFGAAESTHVGIEAAGQPTIVKASATPEYSAVGDIIEFTFTVTNESEVSVSNVSVVDLFVDAATQSIAPDATCSALVDPAGVCDGESTDLLPGQSAVFIANYVVTQHDLDHGVIVDRATVTAEPERGAPLSNTSDDVTVVAAQAPALTLDKTVSPVSVDAAGDVVEYSFVVTNTGNVSLTAVGVNELVFGGSGAVPSATCPSGTLAPDATVTCSAQYTVTQADMDAGAVENIAVAIAEFGGVGVVSAPSAASFAATQLPSLQLSKSATPATVGSAGQPVTYSFHVTNNGNVTIVDIEVLENDFTGTGTLGDVDCPASVLAPNADMICTAAYVVTQDDVDAGVISNSASASGDDPSGESLPAPPTSSVEVEVVQAPALTLVKTADVTVVKAPGDVVRYEFLVINNGNTTLSEISIDETHFTGSGALGQITCAQHTLEPTASTTCAAEYITVTTDFSNGDLRNTARATAWYGSSSGSVEVSSAASTALIEIESSAGALPDTGAALAVPGLLAGALALLLGGALVASRRRTRLLCSA
ncbi:MAG: LPXTG cell wall anchor domain-containing protein [Microcella sp.]|uniref:DUF7507 domain-containing protein n=1 Tax=Microcella sp. TaxID=1913979 RepID=UPI0024CBD5DF|nr:LPXTG cell wall anchor domain-containing protein [Microcella sp.]UYN83220.1 MAG: LPXTG cell wall anchor domain-containing protein [Microcella sp.]